MKKVCIMILALLLTLSVCCFSASAEETNKTPFFSEEKGFQFVVPHEYKNLPAAVALKALPGLPAYRVDGVIHCTQPEITKTLAADGHVAYVVNFTHVPEFCIQYETLPTKVNWGFSYETSSFKVFDPYTGRNYTSDQNRLPDEEDSEIYEDAEHGVKVIQDYTGEWSYAEELNDQVFFQDGSFDYTMKISAPADEADLVLGIQFVEPVSEDHYDRVSGHWADAVGETWDDYDNIGNWEFIRLKDYAEFKTLENGSRGEDVKALQQQLKDMGFLSGGVDGDYGSGTTRAVSAFQASVGMEETGIADNATICALYGIGTE